MAGYDKRAAARSLTGGVSTYQATSTAQRKGGSPVVSTMAQQGQQIGQQFREQYLAPATPSPVASPAPTVPGAGKRYADWQPVTVRPTGVTAGGRTWTGLTPRGTKTPRVPGAGQGAVPTVPANWSEAARQGLQTVPANWSEAARQGLQAEQAGAMGDWLTPEQVEAKRQRMEMAASQWVEQYSADPRTSVEARAIDESRQALSWITSQAQTPNLQLMVTQMTSDMLKQLDAAEARITQAFQQAMGGLDPATQNALALLRESINVERQRMMSDLNRRGLLQSGIALEVEQRFRTGALLAEESVIAEQFRGLQTQMMNALMAFATQRLNVIQQMGVTGIQAAQWEAGQRQQAAQAAMQYGTTVAGLGLQERSQQQQAALQAAQLGLQTYGQAWSQQYARQQALLQQQQAEWDRMFQEAQLTGRYQGLPTLQAQQFGFQQQQAAAAQQMTAQQQLAQQAYQKLMQGYTMNQLTEGERLAVGQYMAPQQVDMNQIYQKATAMAQQDIRVLTGQAPLNQVVQEYVNYLQGNLGLQAGGGTPPPPGGPQANYWPGIWNEYGLISQQPLAPWMR